MGRWNRADRRRGGSARLVALACLLFAAGHSQVRAAPQETVAEQRVPASAPELYRWVDRLGVVRYTPDLDRIPDARRKTAVRVIPGSVPTTSGLAVPAKATRIPTPPTAPIPQPVAPGSPLPDADPFNAPSEARTVEASPLGAANPAGTGTDSSWPELDARIAELELLVQRDEEIIKEMISAPSAEDYDDLIDSEQLREVAARLPQLQVELEELKRWREEPDPR